MGRPGGLLRYADLDPVSSASGRARDARAFGDVVDAEFRTAAAGLDDMADGNGAGEGGPNERARRAGRRPGDPGDGTKTLARIEKRMASRADRTALRDALDLIRQEELLENIEMRRARSRQRRWYVIGRALDELMETDAALRAAVLAALDRHLKRRDERQLLGLAPLETQLE
jgi:hypothetical protein